MNKKYKNQKAFTLAEVLITLGIIGVVAALTIPTLMQKQQEMATASALKKAYSALSSAYNLAVQENGTPDNWNLIGDHSVPGAANLLTILAPYLNITKNCGTTTDCFPDITYKLENEGNSNKINADTSFAKVQLSDGTLLALGVRDQNCLNVRGSTLALSNVCAVALVDTNGFKTPSQFGVDAFFFSITKYGIVPAGTQQETTFPFDPDCKTKSTSTGYGCTAWVIYNGNMDYLHCNNLDWSGPTKCN